MKRLSSFPVTLAALGLLTGPAASASSAPAYSIANTFGLTFFSNATAGFEFHVNSAITVTDLGLFDSLPTGLVNSHRIGIFNLSGTLLGSGTVAAGTVSPLTGQFRYTSIAPLNLAVGNYRIGAYFPAFRLPQPSDASVYVPFGASIAPEVSYVNGFASLNSGGLVMPATNGGFGFFGPNFKFNVTPVPELSSLMHLSLLAVAGSGLLYRRRRQALRHA